MAILLISFIGCLSTGGVLVNAQEDPQIEYRLENIEKLLAELRDEMKNMHSSYVTREIFDVKLSALDSTMGTELSALRIEMSAITTIIETEMSAITTIIETEMSSLKTTTETELKSVNKRVDMIWNVQLAVIVVVFGAYVTPILAETYKKYKT